jgi:hypothetical protein
VTVRMIPPGMVEQLHVDLCRVRTLDKFCRTICDAGSVELQPCLRSIP